MQQQEQLPKAIGIEALGQSDFELSDKAEDIRGRIVRDSSGAEIGTVEELLIDRDESKVRFVRISSGGVLGFGAKRYLLPVELISRTSDDAVHIDRSRTDVESAPAYEPELVADRERLAGLYGHYGYTPYWAPGYLYPPFPPRR